MDSSFLKKIKELIKGLPLKNKGKKFNKIIIFAVIISIVAGGFAFAEYRKKVEHEIYTRAFKIIYNGNYIGTVRNKEIVNDVVTMLKSELTNNYGIEVSIEDEFEYQDTHAEDNELTKKEDIKNNLKDNIEFNVFAYAIEADGKVLGILKTEDLAQEVLNKIKEPYIKSINEEESSIEDIKFVENVKIVKKEVPISAVEEFDKVLNYIQKGTDEVKTHVVKKGENFWTIAHKYNLTVDDLVKANPDKNPKLIHPGDELSLIVPKPYLTVATYEEKKYIEKIDFDIKYEYSSEMYKDQAVIKRRGVYGKKEVVAKIEKHNGIEVAKEILKETIISNPVSQIIIKGTKEIPPLKATGIFITPTRGTLTSGFGMRWGRMHEGIDLAARVGTPIKAADGGVVTFAGWKSTYGYMVEIDHGGGFTTRYAHCSKIYVKKGEKVYKGKIIAAVGNTGRSTGPHLHFEVRKYGKPENPYKYLGKKYR